MCHGYRERCQNFGHFSTILINATSNFQCFLKPLNESPCRCFLGAAWTADSLLPPPGPLRGCPVALPQLVNSTLTCTIAVETTARKIQKSRVRVWTSGTASSESEPLQLIRSLRARLGGVRSGWRAGTTHCLRLGSARKAHKNTSCTHTRRRVEPSGGNVRAAVEGGTEGRGGNSVNSPRMNLGRRREPGGVCLFFNLLVGADGREKVTNA